MKVHFFTEEKRIVVRGGIVTISEDVSILCEATRGNADNRRRFVTCEDCKLKLKATRRGS